MISVPKTYDVAIIGAGAAGLLCAIEAGRRGRTVLLLDHADRAGKKILISGGGRCNFTNLHCRPENFLSANPHFAKSALARYTPADFIALVESHGIAYHEKTLGQLFCDGSARQIVAMLLAECTNARIELLLRTTIARVTREPDAFALETTGNGNPTSFHAAKLVIATGGLSIPKMGATGFAYDLARQFGLNVITPRPALVPLVLDEGDREGLCDLAGVSAEVALTSSHQTFREKLLVTHRGLSGPAVLQSSSYWVPGHTLTIDWAPERDLLAPLLPSNARRDAPAAKQALRLSLPARLADRLIDLAAPASSSRQWTNNSIAATESLLHQWPCVPAGIEGYDKAEVTAGGIDTAELSAHTMEARRVPGLHLIGEAVDVTGHLGGYNFQWAWASGAAAGRAV